MEALGMFEVQGYLQAVVGADTALKAANVKLANITKVKGGLVSVILTGDVGAIEAAISAVKHEIPQDLLKSSHVIARPSTDIGSMYQRVAISKKEVKEESNIATNVVIEPKKDDIIKKVEAVKAEVKTEDKVEANKMPQNSTKK